jgi:ATP-binding cassette subfamily B protein
VRILTVLSSLVRIAWRSDPVVTGLYFATAALVAALPLGVVLTQRSLVDTFLAMPQGAEVPLALMSWLALRYALGVADGFVRWVLHGTTLDHLVRYRMQNAMATAFAEKLSGLDQEHLEDPQVQDLIAKTRETYQWRTVDLVRMLAVTLTTSVSWLGALLLLLRFGVWVPLALMLCSVPRLLVGWHQGTVHWSMWGSGAPQIKRLYYLSELLTSASAIPELRVFRSAPALLRRFREVQESLFQLNSRPLLRLVSVQWVPAVVEGAAVLALAASRLDELVSRQLTLGDYVLLLGLAEAFVGSGIAVVTQAAQIRENVLFARHFFEVMTLPRLVEDAPDARPLPPDQPPRIEFREVSFDYPDGTRGLDRVSFVIEPGQWIAFVGPNGAGKSTLVKLLCRFYDPTDGQILVDGRDLRSVPLDDWHAHLGTLFQRFVDFHFTVRENVGLGRPDLVDDERLRSALQSAGADFVWKLPKGPDTLLGREFEDGVELSWGQWQKLAFARAFYQDPPVLVLDEPTSAIDAEAEATLFTDLRARFRHRTTVVVSHRFSTVRRADLILVVEAGRIAERGTHTELMEKQGRYHAMFTAQAEGYGS